MTTGLISSLIHYQIKQLGFLHLIRTHMSLIHASKTSTMTQETVELFYGVHQAKKYCLLKNPPFQIAIAQAREEQFTLIVLDNVFYRVFAASSVIQQVLTTNLAIFT